MKNSKTSFIKYDEGKKCIIETDQNSSSHFLVRDSKVHTIVML